MKRITLSRRAVWICTAVALICGGGAYYWFTGGVPAVAAEAAKMDLVKFVSETGTVESKSAVSVVAKSGGEVGILHVEEGDKVGKGQLLLESDASSAAMDVAGIQAQAAGVRAQYKVAKELADKNKKLYEEGAISYDVYAQSKATAEQLAAQVASLGYSAASVSEATGGGKIKAPIDGVITQVYAKEGETVQPGAPILEISGLLDTYVNVNIIAEDADMVKEGMRVSIYNDKDELLLDNATVRKVALKAQDAVSELGISQKRVNVEVALPDDNGLRLGTEVEVKIHAEEKTGVLTVPEKAVFDISGKDYVYVIEGGKAVQREVAVGLEGEDDTEILSGLSEGDLVVVSPEADVEDGTRLKITEAQK